MLVRFACFMPLQELQVTALAADAGHGCITKDGIAHDGLLHVLARAVAAALSRFVIITVRRQGQADPFVVVKAGSGKHDALHIVVVRAAGDVLRYAPTGYCSSARLRARPRTQVRAAVCEHWIIWSE